MVVANYGAILSDFGWAFGGDFRERYGACFCSNCAARGLLCRIAVDRWLLDQSAYLSLRQVERSKLNSAVYHGAPKEIALRPPRYGRALVLPVAGEAHGGAAFIDVKGSGVGPDADPTEHANGLEYLGVALADFFYGNLVDRIFARTCTTYYVLPTYAVVDYGFDIVQGWFGRAPAGLHVRRAHAREDGGIELPLSGSDEEKVGIHIELILRNFGLTTTGTASTFEVVDGTDGPELYFGGRPLPISNARERAKAKVLLESGERRLELTNVQTTRGPSWAERTAHLIDLGTIHPQRRFTAPVASPARDGLLRVGRILRFPDGSAIQPDPQIAVDAEMFGRDTAHAFGLFLAQCFREERLDSRQVRHAICRALLRTGV